MSYKTNWTKTAFVALLAAGTLVPAPLTLANPPPVANSPPAANPPPVNRGPSTSPDYFPIGVWLQSPYNASRYQAAGINFYFGLWQGPTEDQLTALTTAQMPVVCLQNSVGLAHKDDPTIIGWMHQDEPDNAQPITDPATGKPGYGPCVPPAQIVADYARMRAADPSRPVLLNLGEGVANDDWIGRGAGASLSDYPQYVLGCDIASFDVYPVAGLGKTDGENYLWYVPKGVSRLVEWIGGRKPVWTCIECTHIGSAQKPTPAQVRSEVWMALIHGSRGLVYFVHEFQPKFNEHALLDDPPMLAAVTALNKQVQSLAPVLNSSVPGPPASVRSSSEQTPIDIMTKRRGKTTYLFAAGMRNAAARGAFTVRGLAPFTRAEVIGEGRTISVKGGRFQDAFSPYAVHLYKIQQ